MVFISGLTCLDLSKIWLDFSKMWLDFSQYGWISQHGLPFIFLYLPNGSGTTRWKGKVKSKGIEINHGEQLSCQNYLLPNNILRFHKQKLLFSYISRMNKLLYNQPGTKQTEISQCGKTIRNKHFTIASRWMKAILETKNMNKYSMEV